MPALHSTIYLVATLCLTGFTVSAAAQNAAALNVRALSATCANCHGTEGRSVPGAAVPSLAGMPKAYMLTQMKAFKDGSRPATVMHQLSKGFSDAQIETMATYFSGLKP